MAIASQWPAPPAVLQYYNRAIEALASLKRSLAEGVPQDSYFVGMEVELALLAQRNELDQSVVLLLVASFEATLQVDFDERVTRKLKDSVSKELRRLWFRGAPRHGVKRWVTVEEIADVWRKHVGQAAVIGNFKQLFLYRHWLAHGRYWTQKSGLGTIDPFDAWQRGLAMFQVLPGFEDKVAAWQAAWQ